MKPKIIVFFFFAIVLLQFAICFKLYNKYQNLESVFIEFRDNTSRKKNSDMLFQLLAQNKETSLDSLEHHVICIGNSITKHPL